MNDKKVNFIVNKTIAVDNLELNFKGNIPLKVDYLINKTFRFNDNCHIEYLPIGSKMFQVIANMYINDRLIGELRFSPRKGFFDSDLINFKFANILLYSTEYQQYKAYFIDVLGFEYICINHIDVVSYSTGTSIGDFTTDYYYKSDPKKAISKQYQTRCKGKIKRDSINISTVIHWGKMTADKSIKIYPKTLELIEQSPEKRAYLEYYWKLNGLDYVNNTIESFELSLRHYHSKMIDFDRLTDSNYLASILQTHCKNFFDFEKEYRNHDKTYYKDVTPITFDDYETIKIDKYRQEKQYTLKSIHTVIKNLYIEYLEAKFIASDIYVINDIIKVPDRLKDHQTIMFSIDTLLAKYSSANKDFKSKKSGYEKEFEQTNDLYNKRITIENHVKAIKINDDLQFSTPDFSDPKYSLRWYQNLTKDELKLDQIHEYRMEVFNRGLKSAELLKLQQDADSLKKINKVSIDKTEKNFRQSIILRDLNAAEKIQPKNNSAIKTDTDMFNMNDRVDDKVFQNMIKPDIKELVTPEPLNQSAKRIINEFIKFDSIESNLDENNLTFINELYKEYTPMETKNVKVSFTQFMKVLIFALATDKENRTWKCINDTLATKQNDNFPFVCNNIIDYIMTNHLNINLTIVKIA